jgi:hypothetical protein
LPASWIGQLRESGYTAVRYFSLHPLGSLE